MTSYDIATRDVEDLSTVAWDRLLLDEAQDVKNPATKRARALRQLPARRRLAMTGTPIENRLQELWAMMDIVNPGLVGFARVVRAHVRGPDRAVQRRACVEPAEVDGAAVHPAAPKDADEVELELPPITVEKDYCKLTVEQAALYRATVDRWMPQIEQHESTFNRRGAVLAMLGQLKQVCNHPEMVLHQGGPLEGRSGKLERLVELLKAVPDDDKSLVFTQYPGFAALVPHLEERLGKKVGFFHGRLTARQRDELLVSFTSPGGPERAGDLNPCRRPWLEPAGGEPRVPLRSLVEPGRGAAGDGSCVSFGQRKPVFVHSV